MPATLTDADLFAAWNCHLAGYDWARRTLKGERNWMARRDALAAEITRRSDGIVV